MNMFETVAHRQAALHDRLAHIMEGKDPDRPSQDLTVASDALDKASDEELEHLITDPMLEKVENQAIREQVVALLSARKGNAYVDDLIQQAEKDQLPYIEEISGGDGIIGDKTPAIRAREFFEEHQNPLAQIIPDDLLSFTVDSEGNFYMEQENAELLHMRDFDLMMEEEVSGLLDDDRVYELAGLTAVSQMEEEVVEFRLLEFFIQGQDVTITTDHPLARVVHLIFDDFIVVQV